MAYSTRLYKEAHATLACRMNLFSFVPKRPLPKCLGTTAPHPFSTTATTQARLPYFHKKLTKKSSNSTPEPTATPSDSIKISSCTKQALDTPEKTDDTPEVISTASKADQDMMSNRQRFRSIVPDPQIMREIRRQGLGENAQYWKFEGRTTNKTVRPWDKRLTPQEYRALQREKQWPAREVWFDTQTIKVVEKQEVKFPTMRFVAGAATVQSIPSEQTVLRLTRPYLFEELDTVDHLLEQASSPSLAQDHHSKEPRGQDQQQPQRETDASSSSGSSTDSSALQMTPPPTQEELQRWRAKKREQQVKLRDMALKEIAVVGRSNVGKSTLLNALTESPNTAHVSDKPGLTRQLNFYRCGEKFVMVDMPGYGFAFANDQDKQTWSELIETYVTKRKTLQRIYVMIDARHGLKVADRDFMTLLDKGSTKFQVVLTKCDLVPPPDLARRYTTVLEDLKKTYRNAVKDRLIMVSSYTGAGMNNLRKDILWACHLNILVRDRDRPESTIR